MFSLEMKKLARKILGSSRKAAPPRPRTRLCLEALEDRTLPSAPQAIVSVASPPAAPPVAAMLSSVDSAMDRWGHLITTIQQDVIGEYQVLSQELVQAMYSVEQQVGRLFGINLPSQNQPNSGSGRGNSSGAGSGSGATTSHNNHNQPSNNTPLQSGSGFGSGSGATSGNENGRQQGSTYSPLAGGGGGSCGSGSTTVEFGENGYTSVYEEVNCNPTSVQVPIIVGNPDPNCPVSVQYKTVDGTAAAGTDYTYESGTASFDAAGDPVWVTIPILDDGTDESQPSDYFTVQLSNPVNATLGGLSTFTVYIEEQTQKATDTLRWNPCMGNNASTVQNWYDVQPGGQGFQLQKGAMGPNASSPIQFDANPADTPNSNAPITWDQSYTVASISLNEYTGQETLDAGDTLELLGADDVSLNMDANSDLKGEFAPSTTYKIDKNATITNMDVFGDPSARLEIAGGTTTIAGGNYTENLGVRLQVDTDATLNHQGQTKLSLTAQSADISVFGTMNVAHGPNAEQTLIDRNSGWPYIYVSGKLAYSGTRGVTDTFNVPVLVANGGTFIVAGNQTQLGNSKLVVQGDAGTTTNNCSVDLTDTGSSVQLSLEATLECDAGYYQDGGSLETTDTTICTLQCGATGAGTATIDSGQLIIAQTAGYGQLNVEADPLEFSGQLVVAIDASKPNQQGDADLLNVSGTTDLKNNPTLKVIVRNGPPQPNQGPWVIIKDSGGAAITGNFAMPITTDPQTNLTAQVDPNKPSQYILKS